MSEHPSATNPVLEAADVSDETAIFVADPFVVKDNDIYTMFFEVAISGDTKIGYATSSDGLAWEYQAICLDRTGHLAYPHVFQEGGTWYMTPDTSDAFRIYQATNFPTTWTLAETAFTATCIDPTVFKWGGKWWCIYGSSNGHDQSRLRYSDSLIGGTWTEHPFSPIKHNTHAGRPAGRPVLVGDGSLADDYILFFWMDSIENYGDKVRTFAITTLTTAEYTDFELTDSPVLEQGGDGWRADGMHQIDSSVSGIVVVDGYNADNGDVYAIGIYQVDE